MPHIFVLWITLLNSRPRCGYKAKRNLYLAFAIYIKLLCAMVSLVKLKCDEGKVLYLAGLRPTCPVWIAGRACLSYPATFVKTPGFEMFLLPIFHFYIFISIFYFHFLWMGLLKCWVVLPVLESKPIAILCKDIYKVLDFDDGHFFRTMGW